MKSSNLILQSLLQLSKKFVLWLMLSSFFISIHCDKIKTSDWPTYRHDNARSGITEAKLNLPLSLHMTIVPTHAPQPAWPEPGEERARMHSDNVYHISATKDKIFFGSSVDNKVYALDINNGQTEWTFYTEGPVRYSPTIWKNHLYFGSDDGYIYCLNSNDGTEVWKYRAGPSDEKVLGNSRMISLWPVRTSVLVDRGIVYFGAGVFPYEGIYICALNADDGSLVWKNDTMGDRAHELAFGGISPQSYLLASEDILYVPSGRAMPAAFDIKSGEFLYYCLPGGKVGGTWALLNKDNLISGVDYSGTPAKAVYDKQTGNKVEDVHAWFPGIELIIMPDVSYTLTEGELFALDRNLAQSAMGKMKSIQEEIQKQNRHLRDIRRKLRDATDDTINKLNHQGEELSSQIEKLAEKETHLKNSVLKWRYEITNMKCMILVGDILFAAGKDTIIAVDANKGAELWKQSIEGTAYGVAAVDGNLFVSTDQGNIYCFADQTPQESEVIKSSINSSPYVTDEMTEIYAYAAEEIINSAGCKKGYCLVLDCGIGRLAYELAKRSEMKIIGLEKNQQKVRLAKENLDAAGIYGSQVVVESWDITSLPDYFANLIVADEMVISGEISASYEDFFRILKPYGGIAFLGQPDASVVQGKILDLEKLKTGLPKVGSSDIKIVSENGRWLKITRGELEKAGSWTEQYGNAQNTASSNDQLVKSPLGVLWFGEPGSQKMVERHAKAASPVSIDGRMFIQGEEVVMAYDAYNGTHLWERNIPGAIRARSDVDGGNLSATHEGLYVAAYDKCYRLNPATGETMQVFKMPPMPGGVSRRWGYLSCANNILYGSCAKPLKRDYYALINSLVENGKWRDIDEIPLDFRDEYEYLKRYPIPDDKLLKDLKRSGALWRNMAEYPVWELYQPSRGAVTANMMASDMVFAIHPETGRVLWKYRGERIAHITISNGDGKVFFAERTGNNSQKYQAIKKRQELIRLGKYKQSSEEGIPDADVDVRVIVALDAVTGQKMWQKAVDLTGCGGDGMASAYQDGVLVFFASSGTHDAWRFQNGSLNWRRVTALSASDGKLLWSYPLNYNARPVIVGDQIFIEPRACNLHTGEIINRTHPITGKQVPWEYLRPGHTCAITSGCTNMLFYRSSSTAFYDFETDRGLTLFGAIRPGCWINMIPANGVLLFPEASAGCTCSFPLRCSLVLKHKENRPQPWNVFITHGALSSAKHFCINLGAPADMKDEQGKVWFGYPNPKTDYLQIHYPNYGIKFDLNEKVRKDMGYFCQDFKGKTISGTQKPWLFTSGCLGMQLCEIPLIADVWGEEPAKYQVRLGFAAPSGDHPGQRIFDVLLQGTPVMNNFDIIKEAGTPNTAVIKEFTGIEVNNFLKIEFVSKELEPNIGEAPLINFIEILREEKENSKIVKTNSRLGNSETEVLLKAAKEDLNNLAYDKALNKYHTVLDAAQSLESKKLALQGMEKIKSSTSLSRLAKYCRDDDPILWNYQVIDEDLQNSAFKVYIAIANDIVTQDKDKAVRMLKQALKVKDEALHEKVVAILKKLDVVIEKVDGDKNSG